MPGVFHQPIRRRDFLKTSLAAGSAIIVHGCRGISPAAGSTDEVHFALLSDTHIGPGDTAKDPRGFDPVQQLRRVVAEIAAKPPQGAFLNGDAALREGLTTDYQELSQLLAPLSRVAPIYIGFGNHDHRDNFKAVFPVTPGLDAGVLNHRVLILESDLFRFIQLDSLHYVNKSSGLLGSHQRFWLKEYLKKHSEKPIVFFVHHTLGDDDGDLLDAGQLFEIIRPYRQVKAIFYGHSHAWSITERQGVKLINLPSVGYNFTATEPVGWVDARFRRGGVELILHAIAGNRANDGEVKHVRWS